MKQINYTGNSKLIARIVELLNHKAPMPLDGQGNNDWGTNGQVLTTDGQGNTSWTTPQGGGGDVTDVEVNGTSVVDAQGVANVTVPTKTSDLNNDSGFIDSTDLSTALSDYTPTASLATVATSGDYDDLLNKPSIPAAQVQSDWSQADNTQVDYIKNKPSIPTALADLTDDSTHRVVTDTQISTWNGKSDFSGSYNDLTDKPTIPTVNDGTLTIQQNGTTLGTFTANQSGNTTVNLTGGGSTYTEGDGIDISSQNVISVDTTFSEASTRANIASGDSFSTILGKIKKFFTDLKTVAFTGSYSDLTGQPTIPTVNNGTLTIQKNGTNVQTFTANQSGNATANITVPTNTNELTNGAGFITSAGSCASATDVTNAIKQGEWWTSGTSHDANTVTGEAVFAYATQTNVIATGTLVGFSCKNNTYPFQLLSAYGDDTLYYRRKNGDTNTWGSWHHIIHSGNIGNQYVLYATSAGSATKATQDQYGNNIYDNYMLKKTNSGLGSIGGNGTQAFARIAEINTNNAYMNYPICFDVSGRNTERTIVQIIFMSGSAVDPNLMLFTIDTNNIGKFRLFKISTGKWHLYYDIGTWNSCNLHRVFGAGADYATVLMDKVTSLPAAWANGTVPTFGGHVNFATSAGYTSVVKDSGNSTNTTFAYSKSGLNYSDYTWLAGWNGYELRAINKSQFLATSGGTMTGALYLGSTNAFIQGYSNNWVDFYATGGITSRAPYHDFKNAAASAWVSIAAGGFVTQSSRRYKENIEDMTEEEARKLLDVRTVSFDYKNGVRDGDRNKYGQHGVIAEEVNDIISEVVTYANLVREDPESELVPDSVDYSKFVPYLIKMVQIQQKEIDELKAIVKATITETAEE